jgi:O-antigen ligase
MRDRDVLLEAHISVLKFLLIAVGLALATGFGLDEEGRLYGLIPALEPPQVGQVAGVLAGVTLLLVISRVIPARAGMIWCAVSVLFLVMSYTRTAMVALVVGLVLGILSLITTSRRARAVVTVLLLAGPIIVMLVGPVADAWFKRGQDDAQFATLTGRTNAWDRVYAFERDGLTELFGVGLTDKSIDGLPIDSGMLSVYHEEGMVGVVIVVGIFVALVASTVFAPPGPRRAVALFLVTYCLVASYTETGVGDMSSYILSLVIAASLVWGRHSRPGGPMKVKF